MRVIYHLNAKDLGNVAEEARWAEAVGYTSSTAWAARGPMRGPGDPWTRGGKYGCFPASNSSTVKSWTLG